MMFSFKRLTKARFLATSLIAIIAFISLALCVRKKNAEVAPNIVTAQPMIAAIKGRSIQSAKTPIQIDHALITLTPRGFYPSEVTRPEGPFLLAVDSRVGNRDITLRITRDNGAKEKEKSLKKGQSRWRQLIDLSPGRYVLTEADHPEWVCHINIVAR
jgi:hypothetical protein